MEYFKEAKLAMKHRKKSFGHLSFLILLSLVFFLLQCQPNIKSVYIFKASLLVNEHHTWFKAFEHFGELLAQRSDGKIKLEIYPSEQLAKEIEALRLIQAGVIDMTITGSTLTNWFEMATFCELPFLLENEKDMSRLIASQIGKEMEKQMLEKTGLRPVCYFQRGARHLTSNRPIKHPDDLKGLIIRVPNVPSFVTAWSTLGAKPTPMAFSEVFTSLQQGTVEAQENPFAIIKNAGFSEVQKYINLTSHVISWGYHLIGEKQFQKLPEDLKEVFLQAALEMQAYEHQLFLENEKGIRQELEAAGMVFIDVDKAAFIEKCEASIYASLSPAMKKKYNDIKTVLQ